ncbi:hypothetical protein FBZ33_3891 [Micromonospora sp. A202]|nr:hypothetical protein FBZ33_3891 [Micromonospora sp. A202]
MPGASAPSICLDGFVPIPSGFSLQLGVTTEEVPAHVRDAPSIDGLVQVHLPGDALGSIRVRSVLEREELTTAARLSVSLPPERNRTISRDEALSFTNQLGVYLDLPDRVDLVNPADDRFLPITSERAVTSFASASGVRVLPEKHLLEDITTAPDMRKLNNYRAMRGQLRLAAGSVEIGVPRAAVDSLPSRAAEPPTEFAEPVIVNSYAELMSHLDGLAQGQQAKVTATTSDGTQQVVARMHSWGLAVSGALPRHPDSISVSLPVMDTLAPIYAGVGGDNAPLTRPGGAATAAQGASSVNASWAEGANRPPRMPAPAATTAEITAPQDITAAPDTTAEPAAGVEPGSSRASENANLADLGYVNEILPVLERQVEQAEEGLSAEHPDVQRADVEMEQIRARVDQDIADGVLSDVAASRALLALSRAEIQSKQKAMQTKVNDLLDQAAAAGQDRRSGLLLEAVLYRDFFFETSELGLGAERDDERFLLVVRGALDPAASNVTPTHMQKLHMYADELYNDAQQGAKREAVSIAALMRQEHFARLGDEERRARETEPVFQGTADLIDNTYLPHTGLKGDHRTIELNRMVRKLPSPGVALQTADVQTLDRVLESAYELYAENNFGALPRGELTPELLQELLRHTLDKQATLTWADVRRAASVIKGEQTWRAKNPSLWKVAQKAKAVKPNSSKLQELNNKIVLRHSEAIRRRPDQPDSPESRQAELDELWQWLQTPPASQAVTRPAVTRDDVATLVSIRRLVYAHPLDRHYRGLSDYQRIASDLLNTQNEVGADELAHMARELRGVPTRLPLVDLVVSRFDRRAVRKWITDRAISKWESGKHGGRPNPQGHREDPSELVDGFVSLGEMAFVGDLAAWANRSIPFADGEITEDFVRGTLESLFTQALDDGAAKDVTVDGREYGIRLWAVPARPPEVDPRSLPGADNPNLAVSKGELRIYDNYEVIDSSTTGAAVGGDLAVFGRGALGVPGLPSSTRLDAALSGGGQFGVAGRGLTSRDTARFQQIRIKEKMGWVQLPVNWVLRVQDRETGRWRDLKFEDTNGDLREDVVRYTTAEFALPVPVGQAKEPEADYMTSVDVRNMWQFPVWDAEHAVSRLQLSDTVITQVQDWLPQKDWAFFRSYVEPELSNDKLTMKLGDILRPGAGEDPTKIFRLNKQAAGKQFNLSITAGVDEPPITSVMKISPLSTSTSEETRFDDVRAFVGKDLLSVENTSQWRIAMNGAARLIARYLRIGGRAQYGREYGAQFIRHHRALLTRAQRVVGSLQLVLAKFKVKLSLAVNGDEVTNKSEDISGFAHFLVHKDTLKNLHAVESPERSLPPTPGPTPSGGIHPPIDAVELAAALNRGGAKRGTPGDDHAVESLPPTPGPTPSGGIHPPIDAVELAAALKREGATWWTPGDDWGLTMDYIRTLGGREELYNEIVPLMVNEGYLPAEAKGTGRVSAWQVLQGLDPTGKDVNKEGVKYVNWARLLEGLKEATLLSSADDLLNIDPSQPGVVWSFPYPSVLKGALVIGLGARVVPDSVVSLRETPMMVQYGHTSIDTLTSKRARGKAVEAGAYGGVGGNNLGSFWQLQYGRQWSWTRKRKFGETQSTALTSDTDGQEQPSHRFKAKIEWTWFAKRGKDILSANRKPIESEMELLQPTQLNDRPQSDQPQLSARADDGLQLADGGSDGTPSILTEKKMALYTVLGVKGVGELQKDLLKNVPGLSEVDVWRGLKRSTYKTQLVRTLAGGGTIPVGGHQVSLSVRPVGPPRIEKGWTPYTQSIVESQVGREEGGDKLDQKGKPIGVFGGMEQGGGSQLQMGGLSYTGSTGTGAGSLATNTVGSYRGVFQDGEMILVRTAVENHIRVGDVKFTTRGELIVQVDLEDVKNNRDGFDGLDILDEYLNSGDRKQKAKPSVEPDMQPPMSIQHGHFFSVTLQMLHNGYGKLADAMVEAARLFNAPDLANGAQALPAGLSPYMSRMSDGGAVFPLEANRRTFMIKIEAELRPSASRSRPGPSGFKIYERENVYQDASRRFVDSKAAGNALYNNTTRPENLNDGFLQVAPVVGAALVKEHSDTRGANLLSMKGARINGLTNFTSEVDFKVSIWETTSASAPLGKAKKMLSGSTRKPKKFDIGEEFILSVPTEGTISRGAPAQSFTFGLSHKLPAAAHVEGTFGMKALYEAVESAGGGKLVDRLVTNDDLHFDTLRTGLKEMFTGQGARFNAVSIPGQVFQISGGKLRVKARFTKLVQVYYMPKTEIESYAHGTDLVGTADVSTIKGQAGVAIGVTGPVAIGANVGGQASIGGQGYLTTSVETNSWIEHRSWLRQDTSLFAFYALVEYDVTLPSRSQEPLKVPGAVSILVKQKDALAWGIPIESLMQVVPPKHRAKEFRSSNAAAESASAEPTTSPPQTYSGTKGDSDLSPAPEWLRMSLARTERPDENTPNLLSDSSVLGARAVPPPKDLVTTANKEQGDYFIWLSKAPGKPVDPAVFSWLNERLEQLAQAGKTPIVVTRGQPFLDDAPGSLKSVPGAQTSNLMGLLSKYGAAVVHQVPQSSSGGLGGMNLDNSWTVRGSVPAAAARPDADATWLKITAGVVAAARKLARSPLTPVSEAFGELVWGAQGVRDQVELLRRDPSLRSEGQLNQAAEMSRRVPTSMKLALVRPLLSFGAKEQVVVEFTEAGPEQRPKALLEAVARLELDEAGKLNPQGSGSATHDLVDLVQAVRLGADEAEQGVFDFTVSVLEAIRQVKEGRFEDATQFIDKYKGKLVPAQKKAWLDALESLSHAMDGTERVRFLPVLEAVVKC